jgi:hypothetical protein
MWQLVCFAILPRACFTVKRARKLRKIVDIQDRVTSDVLDIHKILETQNDVKLLLEALLTRQDLWFFKH